MGVAALYPSYARHCPSPVGWVERSETHRPTGTQLLQLRLRIRRIQRLHRIKRLELRRLFIGRRGGILFLLAMQQHRSEEHTSELQSLMRISYAVFCLKKKHRKTIQKV